MNLFGDNLSRISELSSVEQKLVDESFSRYLRSFKVGEVLVESGTSPMSVYLLMTGWACRFKYLSSGRRQIVAFVIPFDVSDLDIWPFSRADHSMACLTPVIAARLPRKVFDEFLGDDHPGLAKALKKQALLSSFIQREWTFSLGARSASQRIAHLICELFHRLRAIGETNDNRFFLPLTQFDLADATGLSIVHVNRIVREMRETGMISISQRIVTIPNLEALEEAALFSPEYLEGI